MTTPTHGPPRRVYEDPCGLARALDAVEKRWSLLIVRELLFGPKRFSDLHRGLPTLSRNVLSHRLRDLERVGVLTRHGPHYDLTDLGCELEPTILALARWGCRLPITTDADLSPEALALALKTMFDPTAAHGLRAHYALHLGTSHFHLTITDRRLHLTRTDPAHPPAPTPDATLTTTPGVLQYLIFGDGDLDDALTRDLLTIDGDPHAAARLLTLFTTY